VKNSTIELTADQVLAVSGGDSWAGTPEGRTPVPKLIDCITEVGMQNYSDPFNVLVTCLIRVL